MLVLKGIFGGSPEITLQNQNNPQGKHNSRRFSGITAQVNLTSIDHEIAAKIFVLGVSPTPAG